MPKAGDIVIVDFTGATGVKRRPAVVVSSDLYHRERPDVILGALTSNVAAAIAPTDYALRDWASAGLHSPTAFRAYFGMSIPALAKKIGELSTRDWDEVRARIKLAFA